MDFVRSFEQCRPQAGRAQLFWLGQAGFLIKTHDGRTLAIDPYFTDNVLHAEKNIGFKRLTPPVCAPDAIAFDVLLISHEHGDHFDAEAIADMMKNGATQVYTNRPVAESMAQMGLDMSRVHVLVKGEKVDLGFCTLLPVDCDHGTLAPEALGFILDFGFTRVYYAGDTALSYDRLTIPMAMKPEIAILPINGAFGNLNGYEAAEYASYISRSIIKASWGAKKM